MNVKREDLVPTLVYYYEFFSPVGYSKNPSWEANQRILFLTEIYDINDYFARFYLDPINGKFEYDGLFYLNGYQDNGICTLRYATDEERNWLLKCIELDRYISLEEFKKLETNV